MVGKKKRVGTGIQGHLGATTDEGLQVSVPNQPYPAGLRVSGANSVSRVRPPGGGGGISWLDGLTAANQFTSHIGLIWSSKQAVMNGVCCAAEPRGP